MFEDSIDKTIADKYHVESLIREGENGDLFAARHEIRDTPLTIKILPQALSIDARWTKRFIDEARRASAAADPNILNITDFGTDARGVTYAVYEPIVGKTLRDVIDETETFDQDRAITLARQIAGGLSAAHEKNVIHGHLDPSNIFVRAGDDGKETIKVYGFGSDTAKVDRDADPRYLAPEQLTSTPTADQRTDVYALGAILFQMLSGVVPFDGTTPAGVLKKINAEPPPPMSAFRRDLHPEVEPIILTALAADPSRRYESVKAFAEDLALAAGQPVLAAAAAAGERKRNPWQAAAIVLGGVILLAGALIYATTIRKTDITAQTQAEPGSLPVQPIGPATGAQEESLSKMPDLTEADIAAMQAGTMDAPPGTLPGGDGYNAWANNGAPPLGAPPAGSGSTGVPTYVAPPGQTVTIDPNGGSQFMPQSDGIILVPVPVANSNSDTTAKPSPTPKAPAGNTATPTGTPAKPMATPLPKATDNKPAKPSRKPGEKEEE